MLRWHLCRVRLCSFELQSKPTPLSAATRALAAMDCYASCMRIAEAACTLPRDEVARWPFSISFGYSIACICLIRLLSTEDGRLLDMNAALTQISAVFRVASELNVGEDGIRRRFNHLISYSAKDAHTRRLQLGVATDYEENSSSKVYSRMGLSNWLHASIEHAHNRTVEENIRYDSDDEREESGPLVLDPPSVDPSMFTSSDFDDILASFSRGEWSVPVSYFTAG
ncbi:hypothetical protein FIBSPDRAFT_81067 [Athelia psychrophila]|uniref:Uncharacterized protein n=1 Tax=Athelia psychrophila TaxID=1759441 RepID=A0A166EA80_9AGAM|nr:hypothetical protein FIBSPDRAFT_81067 [Fibularhizoctonia sp. CBS 109695]